MTHRYTARDLAVALAHIADEAHMIEAELPSLSLAEIFAAIERCRGDTNLAARALLDVHEKNIGQAAIDRLSVDPPKQ
jgi:hypothetical protein